MTVRVARWETAALWLLLGVLGVGAGWHVQQYWPIVAEDAWILFRYARHLGDGLGLVANPGGVTQDASSSLLMVNLLGLGRALGLPIPELAKWIGVASTVATTVLLAGILDRALGAPCAAVAGTTAQAPSPWRGPRRPWLLLLLSLGVWACTDVAVWSVAGLHATFYGLALTVMVWATVRAATEPRPGTSVGLGLVGFLAVIARPEGQMLPVLAFLLLAAVLVLERRGAVGTLRHLWPGLALLGACWLGLVVWTRWYFGDYWPNPAYVKLALTAWSDRWAYLRAYLTDKGVPFTLLLALLALQALAVLVATVRARRCSGPALALLSLAAFATSQGFFVWYSGGDYMAFFRFLVPIHPLLIAWVVLGATLVGRRLGLERVLPLTVVLVAAGAAFRRPVPYAAMPITSGLITPLTEPYYQRGVARLRSVLRAGDVYGLSECGYIPYHLDAPGVDLMMLNQKECARTFGRYPIAEACAASRDFVLAQLPRVIATVGYWRGAGDAVVCSPRVGWFLECYFRSPFFLAHYDFRSELPAQPSADFLCSHWQDDYQPTDRIAWHQREHHDKLLHGFHIEAERVWAGPWARLLLRPGPTARRITLEGFVPDVAAYPDAVNQVSLRCNGATVGDQVLATVAVRAAGAFVLTAPLPDTARAGREFLVSVWGTERARNGASPDLRSLSWVFVRVELGP